MSNQTIDQILCWMVIIVPALMGVILLYRRFGISRRRRKGQCPVCGYIASGNPTSICPECGFDASKRVPWKLRGARWYLDVICGVLLLHVGMYGIAIRYRVLVLNESWGQAIVPTTYLAFRLPSLDTEMGKLAVGRVGHDGSGKSAYVWGWQSRLLAKDFAQMLLTGEYSKQYNAMSGLRVIAMSGVDDTHEIMACTKCKNDFFIQNLLGCIDDRMANELTDDERTELVQLATSKNADTASAALSVLCAPKPHQFDRLSDDNLCVFLHALLADSHGGLMEQWEIHLRTGKTRLIPEAIMLEMEHRGGEQIQQCLESECRSMDLQQDPEKGLIKLKLLMALRKVQHKTSPVKLEIIVVPPTMQMPNSLMPHFKVRLVNTDPAGASYEIWHGFYNILGSISSTTQRENVWNIEVWDSSGKKMKNVVKPLVGGSVYEGPFPAWILRKGESDKEILDSSAYLNRLQPGTYTFRIAYDPVNAITDMDDLSGLMVVESNPISVDVK